MLKYLIAFLPSTIKVFLFRLMGAKIGKHSYIGLAIVDAKHLEIGDCVYIGHFNILWRLREAKIESGARLEMFNWITGARKGLFYLGRNSAVQRFHFLEASSDIIVGNNCILAGRGSHFFSHGISSVDLDVRRPIIIGNWCYIGSGCRFVPGASVSDCTFVGMGSVVTKSFREPYVLVAGSPAVVKKTLTPLDAYFMRPFLPHSHHPTTYEG